jgi:alcohol dehydrogenase (cytochrome c)
MLDRGLLHVLLSGFFMLRCPLFWAEVTPARLVNPEPGNWLMNHRTYDAQRYSPLDKINTSNVKNLKLVYSIAIGGTAINENPESTPLAEDGFLYVVDLWGIVYKIDARGGDLGRITWRMDPKQEKAPDANRGVALWGSFVISVANDTRTPHRHKQGDRLGRLGD